MRMRFLLPLVCAAALLAQAPSPGTPRTPQVTELKAYLGLTDAQVTQLVQLRQNFNESLRSTFDQIRTKATTLRQTLSTTGANPATVGQLVLDVQALRQQITQAEQTFNQQAVALLTADQKTKLQTLADAQKLEVDIAQATRLGLLVPQRPAGIGGFGPFGFAAGRGWFGGIGPAQGMGLGARRHQAIQP